MYKKLCLLVSLVFVLSVCSTTQAQTDINVVNWSFEMDDDVNLTTCHHGLGNAPNVGSWGWTGGAWPGAANPTWSGVDVNCGWDLACADCRDWHVFPDGNTVAYFDMGTFGYQLTDQNITAGHMYTMTADLMTWAEEGYSQPTRLQLYYLEDPCFPDVNHVILAEKVFMVEGYQQESCAGSPGCLDDWQYDQKLQWVAQISQPYDLQKLGIKIGSPPATEYSGSSWAWGDRIRLNWKWASAAYDPVPGDAETSVSKNPTLCWTPGLWTATTLGHHVYFGTDEAAVTDANTNSAEYIDPQDGNCYTPSGPLELGKTYYWRVDEVNSAYSGPLPPPWKGDTWSFEIEGYATNPSPYSGETDIPYLDQSLSWTAGTDATSHNVYFGTDEDAVADANTNSSFEFRGNQVLGNTAWPMPALTVDTTHYWRIDELSAVHPNGLKGKVWNFTTGEFLILDDFDQYANLEPEMFAVWDNYSTNGSDGEIGLQTGDMNYIRGGEGKSMQVIVDNRSTSSGNLIGSWTRVQDMTEMEAGGNWTLGGVKAMGLYLIGDPCNRQYLPEDKGQPILNGLTPWVEVEDTSSNVGFIAYDSPANMLYDYQWFEWNIDCNFFADACGVTLSAIDSLKIGFGGDRVGESKTPTKNKKAYVHVDDLRLYPARCIAELAEVAGNITEGDCTIDNFDMQIMADDWLITDGCFPTSTANAAITMKEGDPNWSTGHFNNALGFDPNIQVDVCNPGLFGLTNMSITCWVRREGEPLEGYIGVVTCREKLVEDSTELACGSSAKSPEVGYCWNQVAKTWQFGSGIPIPDGEWMLMAMAVDPTGATLWGGPAGGTLTSARQDIQLDPLEQFDHRFWIGRGRADSRYFTGKIDDVRIFAKTLDANEMAWLHTDGVSGTDPCCPAYHYELDEASGLTSADDGCGAVVYRPVMSPANLTDPEPVNERYVNFRDFDVMATNWMEEYLWPEW